MSCANVLQALPYPYEPEDMPPGFCVTISGVTDGTCDKCTLANGTHILTHDGDCSYIGRLDTCFVCDECPTEAPYQWTFTLSGVTNSTCAQCSQFNNTFTITYDPPGLSPTACEWFMLDSNGVGDVRLEGHGRMAAPCIFESFDVPTVWWRLYKPGSSWHLNSPYNVTYELDDASWDCCGPNTMTLVPQDAGELMVDACSNWPATVTLTKVGDCAVAPTAVMNMNFGSSNLDLIVGSQASYSKPGTGLVSNAIHTLSYVSSDGTCNTWPATIQAVPFVGGICGGDPHFVGFENDSFDFQGVPGKIYNFLSDYNCSLNALFGDYTNIPGTTYLEEVAILVGTEEVGFTKIRFSSKGGIYVNDKLMRGKKQEFPSGLDKVGSVEINMNPNWQNLLDDLPWTDGVFQNGIIVHTGTFKFRIARFLSSLSHMTIFSRFTSLPVAPHGIIGQTADFDGKPRISTGPNGEGVIDGKPEDYEVKDLFDTEFTFSRFGQLEFIVNAA